MDSKADKLWKKTVSDHQKRISPGECQKYIRLVIDSQILSSSYGREFFTELNKAAITYDVKTLPVKECIVWERSMDQLVLNPDQIVGLSDVWQKENQVIKILTHAELLQIIKSEALETFADNFQKYNPNMQHILLYLGSDENIDTTISSALFELKIMQQLNVLQVRPPTTRELANTVMRLTKAIAEIPYKKQKSELLDSFKKYLANDKKQCVRVEGTNGFVRLWQQHLNRLPLVTLEVADTIIDKYSCPKKLLEDFKNNPDAVNEISDLRIKRSGPLALQTDRRIGNVLANKLFTLYNARDPTTKI